MGTWGTGLYSGDFAMDLRATIGAVVRLPFDADRLVEILCETEPTAASDPRDEEHATFWLVLADQFARRGLVCERVRETALRIIDTSDDTAMRAQLGMSPGALRKRRQILQELRARIVAPTAEKRRVVLKTPQPLIMAVGSVIVYPTAAGRCINPYFPSKERNPFPWTHDGWGAAVIIDCDRAFGFLSWYRPLTIAYARTDKPTLDALRGDVLWRLQSAGTCSPMHFKRMELETIGALSIDAAKVRRVFPGLRPGISAAVSDISIANRLHTVPASATPTAITSGGRTPTIQSLRAILAA